MAGTPAIGRHLFQCAGNGDTDVLGHRRSTNENARWDLRQDLGDDGLDGAADMRRLSRKRLVEHRSKRVDVAATVDRSIAGGLLGRHVLRGA